MLHKQQLHHWRWAPLIALVASVLITVPNCAFAAEGVEIQLRPHCEEDYSSFGKNIPKKKCDTFESMDPLTYKTPQLKAGDTLDIDIVVHNPDSLPISSVRAWVNYESTSVLGSEIIAPSSGLTEVIPGESDFSAEESVVKIYVAAPEDSPVTDKWILVSRVKFTIAEGVSGGSILNFFNIQTGGHTFILSPEGETEINILEKEPASLFITLPLVAANPLQADPSTETGGEPPAGAPHTQGGDPTPTEEKPGTGSGSTEGGICTLDNQCESKTCYEGVCQDANFKIPNEGYCRRDNQCLSLVCRQGICSGLKNLPNGEGCASALECKSGSCVGGICSDTILGALGPDDQNSSSSGESRQDVSLLENGNPCIANEQCMSNLCSEGICASSEEESVDDRTPFGLLRVRNLRITSERNSAYLAWDALNSSYLKGYNVYYGTTSGEYIQRKTIPGSEPSLTIRNLPIGTKYYFSVRAVDNDDQESAFTQEVAVVVGDPSTATMPLLPSQHNLPPATPITEEQTSQLPGETGAPSGLLLLLLTSACIGTALASRRQFAAVTSGNHS